MYGPLTFPTLSWTRRRHIAGALALVCSTFFAAGAAQAQAQATVKLGFIGPISGGNAQQGLGAKNGFLLAIDQWNSTAGVPFKLEGVVLDDASDPQTGVRVGSYQPQDHRAELPQRHTRHSNPG